MNIIFVAHRCIPIDGYTLDERPLGGTETAVIRLSEELHRRGHHVVVFTSHENPRSKNVRFKPVSLIHQQSAADVCVSVQDWWPAISGIKAARHFFWTGDAPDQFMTFGIGDRRVQRSIERILTVSNWQAQALASTSGYPRDRMWTLLNGVHLESFPPFVSPAHQPRNKRIIHTSAPYRGLAFLPQIFRGILREHPDAELHIYSGLNIYDRDRPFQGPEVQQFEGIKQNFAGLSNCHFHGNVPQAQLAKELSRSAILLYPNIFPETSCMCAIEAQAAGCVVVSTARAGLVETVGKRGVLIAGEPGASQHDSAMVEAVNKLLCEPQRLAQLSEVASMWVRSEQTWQRVADRFESLLRLAPARAHSTPIGDTLADFENIPAS